MRSTLGRSVSTVCPWELVFAQPLSRESLLPTEQPLASGEVELIDTSSFHPMGDCSEMHSANLLRMS